MRLPRVARPRLAGAVGVARAQMGPLQWVGLGSAVSTTTNVGQALLTSRPTLASRLWTWLGSEGIARRFGGGALPTFIAEVLLVVATISLVQFLVRLVRHGIALVQAVTKRADMDESAADDDENSVAARGPTGSPRNSLSPPKRSLPVIPLAGLTVAVLGASLLDSAAAVGLLATVPAWVWLVTWLRLGCDMLLEVALAAVALHLLDVLRSRIVSEDGAKLGQKIMSGGPPTAARPRQLDRRASMKEARVNTLVQSLAAAVWVCTVFALLDTAGINYQALLTLGGVSSVLLGFVGRDILSNLMGATVLYATQPFTKGDWIQSIKEASDGRREVDGWVEKIGWYYTVINTWDKRPLHMPNAKLATMEVINASRMTNRRILWQPKIRLADMSVMPQIVSEMREALLANPELDPTQHRFVFLRSVSDFSLDLWISCHTTSVYLEDFLRINQGIIFALSQILRRHGARFADRNQREARILRADAPSASSAPVRQRRMVPVGGTARRPTDGGYPPDPTEAEPYIGGPGGGGGGGAMAGGGAAGYAPARRRQPSAFPTGRPFAGGAAAVDAARRAAAGVAARRRERARADEYAQQRRRQEQQEALDVDDDDDDDDVDDDDDDELDALDALDDDDAPSGLSQGKAWRRPRIAIDVDAQESSAPDDDETADAAAADRADGGRADGAAAGARGVDMAGADVRDVRALLAYQAELELALRTRLNELSSREGSLASRQQAAEEAWERRFDDALKTAKQRERSVDAAADALDRREQALAARERSLDLRAASSAAAAQLPADGAAAARSAEAEAAAADEAVARLDARLDADALDADAALAEMAGRSADAAASALAVATAAVAFAEVQGLDLGGLDLGGALLGTDEPAVAERLYGRTGPDLVAERRSATLNDALAADLVAEVTRALRDDDTPPNAPAAEWDASTAAEWDAAVIAEGARRSQDFDERTNPTLTAAAAEAAAADEPPAPAEAGAAAADAALAAAAVAESLAAAALLGAPAAPPKPPAEPADGASAAGSEASAPPPGASGEELAQALSEIPFTQMGE